MEDKRPSALEIYRQGFTLEPCASSGKLPLREYYFALRSALWRELQETGGSRLLWYLCRQSGDSATLEVILELRDRLSGKKPFKTAPSQIYIWCIKSGMMGQTRRQLPLDRLDGFAPYPVSWQETQAPVLSLLETAYESFLAGNRGERPEPFSREQPEPRESYASEALEKKEGELAARERALTLQEQALEEKNRDLEAGKQELRVLQQDLEEEKSRLQEEAGQIRSDYLRDSLDEARQQQRQYLQDLLQDQTRAVAPLEDFHREMCERSNAIQASWVKALEAMSQSFEASKNDLFTHLHQWQQGLYPADLKGLAQLYVDLYRFTNLDGSVSQLLLELEDSENQADRALLKRLQRLQNTMGRLLTKYETVMKNFELVPFFPEIGDPFDDYWHILYDDASEEEHMVITRCLEPGVMRISRECPEGDLLIQARVHAEAGR